MESKPQWVGSLRPARSRGTREDRSRRIPTLMSAQFRHTLVDREGHLQDSTQLQALDPDRGGLLFNLRSGASSMFVHNVQCTNAICAAAEGRQLGRDWSRA